MSFQHNTFFEKIKPLFGGSFKQAQVDGLDAILTEWETRKPNGDRRWLAYMLATAYHETNQQMQPVKEAYWLSENWRKANLSYYPYYGRGYVQLTHKDNYKRAGTAVGQDLVSQPDRALDAGVAAYVMFVGMEEGWFRSSSDGKRHSLPRYFSPTVDDPEGARKIINGTEYRKINGVKVLLATIIAQYHEAFLAALLASESAVAAPGGVVVADATVAATAVGGPAVPPAAAASVGYSQRMVAVANEQWQFFGQQTYNAQGQKTHAGHTEGEDGWYQRIGRYWLEGTNTHGIDGLDHGWPWSAAFVSWVAKEAGASDRFRYSTQHSVFISQGIRDYLNKRAGAAFWTVRLHEEKPAVGDIVCWGREDGVDYDHQKDGDYHGHSDHVVAVEADQVWIIGGNVGNSVTRRPVKLNATGFLEPVVTNGENLFGLMKNRLG